MFKAQRRIMLCTVNTLAGLCFILMTGFLVPETSFLFAAIVAAVIFGGMQIIISNVMRLSISKIERRALYSHETDLLSRFIERLRFSYSVDDFIEAIKAILEDEADCSVLYIDRSTNYVIYNSPDRIASAESTTEKLEMNYA